MTAAYLCELLQKDGNYEEIAGTLPDGALAGVAYISGKVRQGYLFAAAVGAKADGHDYIPEALNKGACLVLCEAREAYETYRQAYPARCFVLVHSTRRALAVASAAYFGYPAERLTLIGLTGTKGKTSTSFMLQSLFRASGIATGLIGTTGIYYGEHYEYIDNSTPESLELHRIFADMLAAGVRVVIMEVSSQALKLERVYGLTFDAAAFTNLSPDHIGSGEHADFEEYFACKKKLFSLCRKAVINADSDRSDQLEKMVREREIPFCTYSCKDKKASFYGFDERFYMDKGDMKTAYTCRFPNGKERRVQVGVPGKFSVYNSLCAISLASIYGLETENVLDALENVRVVGRTEPVKHPKATVPILIDYAHNALSLQSLFDAVRAYHPKRIICVFGCGGNRSRVRRFAMGEIAGKKADLSVITSDNPRFENLDDIIADILTGITKTKGRYAVVKNRADAIRYALEHAESGDVVLLAGKGQQRYEEIGGEQLPFDERLVVKAFYDAL